MGPQTRRSLTLLIPGLIAIVASTCVSGQSDKTSLEVDIEGLIQSNRALQGEIEEKEAALDEDLFDYSFTDDLDAFVDRATSLQARINSILGVCNGRDWCKDITLAPELDEASDINTPEDVQDLADLIAALNIKADELLEACRSSNGCDIRPPTTTTKPQPKPTNPPRSDTPTQQQDRPECEQVILLRALAYDSRGTYEEYDYLIAAAYALPLDWSMTTGFILDDLSNGFINLAYDRLALFINGRCPSNR